MKLHNPTRQIIYALLGNENGAQPAAIFVNPNTTQTVNLSPNQLINFQPLEDKLRSSGLAITP